MLNQQEDKKEEKKPIFQREIKGGFTVLTSVPPSTYGEEGDIVLRNNAGVYTLYAKINSNWRGVALT